MSLKSLLKCQPAYIKVC